MEGPGVWQMVTDVPLVSLVPQVPPTIRHSRAAETAVLHKLRRSRGDRPTGGIAVTRRS